MKKSFLVIALAVALVLAFAATASATAAKTWNWQEDYYSWGSGIGQGGPGASTPTETAGTTTTALGFGGSSTFVNPQVNSNAANPGVHANYQTTTAKCGICHSVHKAKGDGVKLLNTNTATCAGCHIAGTATVTDVVIAWGTAAAPLAGPHNSSTSASTGGCAYRACHSTSPHGAGGSDYALFRSKLLTAAVDVVVASAAADPVNSGVTAALLAGTGGTADERMSVRVGYTCNSIGCHEQSMLPVIKEGWSESRVVNYSGNDAVDFLPGNMKMKTGHGTGTLAAGTFAAAPVASCNSCHDQEDSATRSGYTFPHAQRATGTGAGVAGNAQNFLWYNIAGFVGDTKVPMINQNQKSFDGACLKCHRGSASSGVGFDF